MFSRSELIRIRQWARELGDQEGLNPDWQRALYNLATAADHLDAMISRTEAVEGRQSEYDSESQENTYSHLSA